MLKSLQTIRNYFYSNAKKYKQDKKNTGTNFDLTTDSVIEKY